MMNKPAQRIGLRIPAGIPQLVLGIIGMSLFGAATLVFFILAMSPLPFENVFRILCSSFGGVFAASSILMTYGATKKKLAGRMRSYYEQLEIRRVMPIDDIAAITGRSPRMIRKDIREARKKNMAPDLWTDAGMANIILGRRVYEVFLEEEKNRKRQELKEKERTGLMVDPATAPLEEFRSEGAAAITQILIANEAIPDKEVSAKLSRLEEVTASIFDYVEKHPDRLPDVRKFMQYYLPATLQLLEKYRTYHDMSLQPATVQKARKEIENALDMICASFNNLLDSLYHFETLDVRADIGVLENLLKQEGLTGEQFQVSAGG